MNGGEAGAYESVGGDFVVKPWITSYEWGNFSHFSQRKRHRDTQQVNNSSQTLIVTIATYK